ncbi:MAG: hypothetical protein A3G75_01985 [Verrucomicrobia bacterium RIFCSPLOWO2_12_FULL_64_8]|nr:MAG: hypothetical protein A3G75_01985 [Verrucomicrobia bacterium RIFCSPLOWO2_12_FULL_64_8]
MKSWFDLRAAGLALVLAVAAALPYMTTSVERRDYYYFDVKLTSTAAGTTQVFWDVGRGYNEYDSSRQPLRVEPIPVVYRYLLPMGEIKALRFDPNDGAGTFSIADARVVDYRGRVIRTFGPDDFIPFRQIARLERRRGRLIVDTEPAARDAILHLKLPEPIRLRSDARIWWELGWPVALPVFLVGLLVGTPAVAFRLQRMAGAAGGWLRAWPRAAIILTAAIAVAVQCHPVIFLGRSFASPNNGSLMLYAELPTLPDATDYMFTNTMSSDTGALLFQHLYYPMVQRDALLRHGEWPLWNRYSLGGEPLLGQGQSMFGDPFNFLTILADGAAWAWDVRFVLAHWLLAAGLGFTVWRLTRHLGASLLVTLGGGFVAFFTYRLVHPANFSVCYAPWILWAWSGFAAADTPRRQAGWLGALLAANWIVMTSGTVKEADMLLICLNLAGVALLALLPAAHGARWRRFGLAAAAAGIFVLLAAPWWMSFLTTLRHSYTTYDNPQSVDPLPLGLLLGLFDDIFYRQVSYDENVVAPGLNFLFLLGALWWLAAPRRWREDHAGRALGAGGLVPFALAFGLVPAAVILRVPFLRNILHVGNTFSCPLMLIVAVLAGCGFRDALNRLGDRGWWRQWGLTVLLGAALAVAFFVTAREHAKSPFFGGHAPALALAALVLPVGARWAASSTRPGPLWVVCLLGLPLLLWRHCQFSHSFFNHYAFVPGFRYDLHAPSPAVAFVNEQHSEPGRVVGWDTNLFPSYNTALRWEGLYGVDALRSRYYHELAVAFGMKRVWTWDWPNAEAEAPKLVPAHDLLNVTHYVATHREPPREIAGLRLLAQRDLDVFASPTAWPRAFFTDRLAACSSASDFAAMVTGRAEAGDHLPFAACQITDELVTPIPTALDNRTVRPATGYRFTANTTRFVIDAPSRGVAVLAETYYAEDFRVTINGSPAPYFRVNHAFKGVAIPAAGRYEINFAYWPRHFAFALVLSGAGVALAGAGAVWLWRAHPPASGTNPGLST